MSGAEAALVLGLISSVIAIVDGAKKVYDAVKDTTGLPEAFREVVLRIPITEDILRSTTVYMKQASLDKDTCKALEKIVAACEARALKMKEIFEKVIPGPQASTTERYWKAVRTLGKGSKVETLMKGISEDVHLLASSHGMKAATAAQITEIQKAIDDLSQLPASVPDHVFQESNITNINSGTGPQNNFNASGQNNNTGSGKLYVGNIQHFGPSEQFNQPSFSAQTLNIYSKSQDKSQQLHEHEKGVLDLLKFDKMDERLDDIQKAHKKTFRWIYEDASLGFVDWLKCGKGIYWVSGKAGCGKSTLMKYLYQDPRMSGYLPRDADNIMIAAFFFHDRGDNLLLKTQEGLFRAILYSLLSVHRILLPVVIPDAWDWYQRHPTSRLHRLFNGNSYSWSLKELKCAFRRLVGQRVVSIRLCLLIDGLDEFLGDHDDIITTLSELLPESVDSTVHVQLCLSSRPLPAFEDAYKHPPFLEVHTLTANDIRTYVENKFDENEQLRKLAKKDRITTVAIREDVVDKAEGVFLWVFLVVRSLVEGLRNGDDMVEIQKRLSELPSGLDKLYLRMLERIEPRYQEQASLFFQIVQKSALPLSPIAFSCILEDPRIALSDKSGHRSLLELEEIEDIVGTRLKSRCVGLLEIQRTKLSDEYDSHYPAGNNSQYAKIQFLHLTVKEFLLLPDTVVWVKTKSSKSQLNLDVQILSACLRQIQMTSCTRIYCYLPEPGILDSRVGSYAKECSEGLIYMIVYHTKEAEKISSVSQLEFLDKLDQLVTSSSNIGKDPRDGGNWHWTLSRYLDWREPEEWKSDFMSYLVACGLTLSVKGKIRSGYNAPKKPGRPLLMYACAPGTPNHAKTPLEWDLNIPELVQILLDAKCNPHEHWKEERRHDMLSPSTLVWGRVLWWLWDYFLEYYEKFKDRHDNSDSRIFPSAIAGVRERCLKTFAFLLDYKADPTAVVSYKRERKWSTEIREISALTIFDIVFSELNDPLVKVTRTRMVKNGAKVKEKHVCLDYGYRNPPKSKTSKIIKDIQGRLAGSSTTHLGGILRKRNAA